MLISTKYNPCQSQKDVYIILTLFCRHTRGVLSPIEVEGVSVAGALICSGLEVMNSHLVQAHVGYVILTAAVELLPLYSKGAIFDCCEYCV